MKPATTRDMLLIKSIAPDASLELSEYTGQWYVSARVDVSNGSTVSGLTEHRQTPDDAVIAFLDALRDVDFHVPGRILVTRSADGDRRHWRWNGAAFAEEPIERFLRGSGFREAFDREASA